MEKSRDFEPEQMFWIRCRLTSVLHITQGIHVWKNFVILSPRSNDRNFHIPNFFFLLWSFKCLTVNFLQLDKICSLSLMDDSCGVFLQGWRVIGGPDAGNWTVIRLGRLVSDAARRRILFGIHLNDRCATRVCTGFNYVVTVYSLVRSKWLPL